ncbi:MAG: MBL fold metallo-hydrolase [Solirubrobacteraceae bacterium]
MDTQPNILPGVHGLGIWAVNWYLVEDQGRLTAVDAGLPGFRSHLSDDLAAVGRSLSDVDALVLTHADPDHVGLAAALQEAGARVLVSAGDEEMLRTGKRKSTDGSPLELVNSLWRPSTYRFLYAFMRSAGSIKPTTVSGAETFADGDVLDVPGSPRVVATPGHTPGHCSLYFESHKALFVGDQMCSLNPLTGSREPQVMPPLMNTSTSESRESLARIEGLEADGVFFGHGEPWRGGVASVVARARN